jgi:predicted aldo/keto reductase-like oxidoreductase
MSECEGIMERLDARDAPDAPDASAVSGTRDAPGTSGEQDTPGTPGTPGTPNRQDAPGTPLPGGYLGEHIPKLGFGLMRLPKIGDVKDNPIDIERLKGMVDRFLEAGYRYFDTAHVYNDGASELAAREALVKRYPRERFLFANKLPYWKAANHADLEGLLATSLERTGLEYFDFYLVHSLGASGYERCKELGVWDFMRSLKADGRARHIGFSLHDTADVLERILTEQPYLEFVQLQINYIDWYSSRVQAAANYEVARRHGVPVIVMEPVKGGGLADMDASVARHLLAYRPQASVASWAFRYLASLEGIITILSGMGSEEQLEDNIRTFDAFTPLDAGERRMLEEVRAELAARETTGCTSCGYCLEGCPEKIAIPGFMKILDDFRVYSSKVLCQHQFNVALGGSAAPSACVACGSCEDICPQHLPIIQYLAEADKLFG